MKTALLLIDIQKDYFPGGRMVLEGSLEAGQKAGKLLEYFREQGLLRVHLQHVSIRPGATFFLPGTEGVEIQADVRPQEEEVVFQKHFPNGFRDTPLLFHLREKGIQRLVIAGMMTHMCVEATARATFDHGFEVWIAGDACATRALSHGGKSVPAEAVQGAFLAALNGTYGRVMAVEDIILQGVDS